MFRAKIYYNKKTGKSRTPDGTEIKDGKVKILGKEYFVLPDMAKSVRKKIHSKQPVVKFFTEELFRGIVAKDYFHKHTIAEPLKKTPLCKAAIDYFIALIYRLRLNFCPRCRRDE